jgi:hypothetical protein
MDKIPRPQVDDGLVLSNLANNRRAGSYPHLQASVGVIQQAYAQYEAVAGNAFTVAPVGITPVTESHLKAHYKSPPKDLRHITTLRLEGEHLICPMCGSSHRGTLDHLLPQDGYGAFAVFSLNLVPACKCNSKRQELLIGPNPGERILHPYFDDCLAERLVKAQFEDLGPVPKISLRLCVDNAHPEYAAIAFHVRSIVQRTAVTGFLSNRWAKLCRQPSLVVRELDVNPPTYDALQHILEKELHLLDDYHEGRNNWYSMFVAGLLDPVVSTWLLQQIHAPGRLADASLVEI